MTQIRLNIIAMTINLLNDLLLINKIVFSTNSFVEYIFDPQILFKVLINGVVDNNNIDVYKKKKN